MTYRSQLPRLPRLGLALAIIGTAFGLTAAGPLPSPYRTVREEVEAQVADIIERGAYDEFTERTDAAFLAYEQDPDDPVKTLTALVWAYSACPYLWSLPTPAHKGYWRWQEAGSKVPAVQLEGKPYGDDPELQRANFIYRGLDRETGRDDAVAMVAAHPGDRWVLAGALRVQTTAQYTVEPETLRKWADVMLKMPALGYDDTYLCAYALMMHAMLEQDAESEARARVLVSSALPIAEARNDKGIIGGLLYIVTLLDEA